MKKYLWWTLGIIAVVYLGLVIIRTVHFYNLNKSQAEVDKINATKLTLDDVIGRNLPPDPGAEADKTVEGIDANNNGIRDDVELAVFAAYPNSAKTRAVLLQYALALQMEMTQTIVNVDTVDAVISSGDRAYKCVGIILSRDDLVKYMVESKKLRSFIEERQLNNDIRKKSEDEFSRILKSHTAADGSCDLDISVLPN